MKLDPNDLQFENQHFDGTLAYAQNKVYTVCGMWGGGGGGGGEAANPVVHSSPFPSPMLSVFIKHDFSVSKL